MRERLAGYPQPLNIPSKSPSHSKNLEDDFFWQSSENIVGQRRSMLLQWFLLGKLGQVGHRSETQMVLPYLDLD
jgi:hypothetical protein